MDLDQLSLVGSPYSTPWVYSVTARGICQDQFRCPPTLTWCNFRSKLQSPGDRSSFTIHIGTIYTSPSSPVPLDQALPWIQDLPLWHGCNLGSKLQLAGDRLSFTIHSGHHLYPSLPGLEFHHGHCLSFLGLALMPLDHKANPYLEFKTSHSDMM